MSLLSAGLDFLPLLFFSKRTKNFLKFCTNLVHVKTLTMSYTKFDLIYNNTELNLSQNYMKYV